MVGFKSKNQHSQKDEQLVVIIPNGGRGRKGGEMKQNKSTKEAQLMFYVALNPQPPILCFKYLATLSGLAIYKP